MPSVLVIDVPEASRGPGLALDRYYPIILETDEEYHELETFLAMARPALCLPDLFDHRASAHQSDSILIARFNPPAPDWPWVSVCRWPSALAHGASQLGFSMARGCYTMELFGDPGELDAHSLAIVQSLSARHPVNVRLVCVDKLPRPGCS